MNQKKQTAVRFSRETKALLEALSQHWHVSQSAILEIAIKEKALRDSVKIQQPAGEQQKPENHNE